MSISRQILKQRLPGLMVTLCLLLSSMVNADERILDYRSELLVHADGSLIVTETIRVRAEGANIHRGIYRDFPTRYKDTHGNTYQVDFKVLAVQRDGNPEPFHTENRSNGMRIYMGSSDRLIEHGIHEYSLRFYTNRQLGFFDDFDELYWNVTGNGWIFPIDHASARIELPADIGTSDWRTSFYTGPQGSTGHSAEVNIINRRTVEIETTQALQPYEGLTVAVGWPKGLVEQPTLYKKIGWFLEDNGAALVLLLGLLAPFGWYIWAWNHFGRDPRKGVIIPRFKPPMGLTPAGCSYILNMSFGKKTFAAAVVSLGVKGYLEIQEEDEDFVLRSKGEPSPATASKGEYAVFSRLFEEAGEVEMDQKNYKVFMKARNVLKRAMKAEHLGRLFELNSSYALPSVVMTITAAIIASQLDGGPPVWIVFALLSLVMHALFLFLLKAPTPAGRRVMDEIEGFRMYLDTAEQDRLERMKSPQLTPEVFETFLPFAFALGVENNWCERFVRELPEEMTQRGGYQPAWYNGNRSGFGALSHLGNNFSSSFSSAISSASSPPGSSSGSGGGGSSGGGGGGGGGGGW